jgi:hypothetical protein
MSRNPAGGMRWNFALEKILVDKVLSKFSFILFFVRGWSGRTMFHPEVSEMDIRLSKIDDK